MGYGPETIRYGAGWAQIDGKLTLESLFDRRLSEGPYYGDRADDFEWVTLGMNWYDTRYPNDEYVVNINLAKILWGKINHITELMENYYTNKVTIRRLLDFEN